MRLGGGGEAFAQLQAWGKYEKKHKKVGGQRFSILMLRIEAVEVCSVSPFP